MILDGGFYKEIESSEFGCILFDFEKFAFFDMEQVVISKKTNNVYRISKNDKANLIGKYEGKFPGIENNTIYLPSEIEKLFKIDSNYLEKIIKCSNDKIIIQYLGEAEIISLDNIKMEWSY